jgi:hypothetical protein
MISDTRTIQDFQTFTFSGHSRKLACKSLQESIHLGHADYACYWALELLCSGLVHSLWSVFFESASLYIHRACPNIFPYLITQYERFSSIEQTFPVLYITEIRNREDARNILVETATALATAKKQKTVTLPKIKPEHDFQPPTIQENIRATSQHFASQYLKSEDPYELTIPFNEFCWAIQSRDTLRSLYWIAWILKFASHQKKTTKQTITCGERRNPYIDSKYARNIVWLFWDVINRHQNTYVDALFKLYCLRWEPGKAKERQTFLITAVLFVTEHLDTREPAKKNELEIGMMLQKIPEFIHTIENTKNTFTTR